MYDASLVCVFHGAGQCLRQRGCAGKRHWLSVEMALQVDALDQLKSEKRLSVLLFDRVDLGDIGVLQPGDRLRVAAAARRLQCAPAWAAARGPTVCLFPPG